MVDRATSEVFFFLPLSSVSLRDVDSISSELDLPVNQVLAFFNKTIRKIASYLRELLEKDVEKNELVSGKKLARMEQRAGAMEALASTLADDQSEDVSDFAKKQRALLMSSKDLTKHVITADAEELENSLMEGLKRQKTIPKSISVPVTAVASSAGDGDNGGAAGGSGGVWGDNLEKKKDKKEKKNKSPFPADKSSEAKRKFSLSGQNSQGGDGGDDGTLSAKKKMKKDKRRDDEDN